MPSSPDSHSRSNFGPSRSPSSTLFASSNSSLEHEEPHSECVAAIDEAFRSSHPPAPTPHAPAPTSIELQQACLQLYIALLDHKLKGKVTDSIVVGFLAANGINKERTGFQEAVTATSSLSSLVKLA